MGELLVLGLMFLTVLCVLWFLYDTVKLTLKPKKNSSLEGLYALKVKNLNNSLKQK